MKAKSLSHKRQSDNNGDGLHQQHFQTVFGYASAIISQRNEKQIHSRGTELRRGKQEVFTY